MISMENIIEEAQRHKVPADHIVPCEDLADFDKWAPGEDGERKVRRALAENWLFYGHMRDTAETWVAMKSSERLEAAMWASVETAKTAARASETSARWTMWAAFAAALSAFVTATVAAAGFFATPAQQVMSLRLDPGSTSLKAEKSLPGKP
jgi:hypothetical protein